MIQRLKVRAVKRSKRARGKMTGVIYLHKYSFVGQNVIVMDRLHYNTMRLKLVVLLKKLHKIKKFVGMIKYKNIS